MENAVLIMDNVKTGVVVSGEGISPAASIDWQLVIMVIWAIGTLTMALWLIFVNRRFIRKLVGSRTLLMFASVDVGAESNSRHKSNVLQMATTMHSGAKGIKERVAMIARNKRMKVSTLVAVLLIAAFSVGCTFTAASERMAASTDRSEPISSQAGLNSETLVIIDPGHGGADSGADFTAGGNEISEKDLNLKVAYLLRDMLKDSGANIEMTRQEDPKTSLEERRKAGNRQ